MLHDFTVQKLYKVIIKTNDCSQLFRPRRLEKLSAASPVIFQERFRERPVLALIPDVVIYQLCFFKQDYEI